MRIVDAIFSSAFAGWCEEHDSEIFTVAAAISTGLAVVSAMRAGINSEKAIAAAEERKLKETGEQGLTPVETIKVVAKPMAPTVVWTGVAIGSMIFAQVLNKRKLLAISGVAALAEATLREYKQTVDEKLEPEQAKAINKEVAEKVTKDIPGGTTSNGLQVMPTQFKFYDDIFGIEWMCDVNTIDRGQNAINSKAFSHTVVTLADLYHEWKVPNIPAHAHKLGWDISKECRICPVQMEKEAILGVDGVPYIQLTYSVPPYAV